MADAAEVKGQVAQKDLVNRLAERFGANFQASAIFGEPIERDGVSVIPVARTIWGFGGGSGLDEGKQGGGGGGAGAILPVGYIEVRDDSAEFKPVWDPRLVAVAIAAVTAVAQIAFRSLARR